MEAYWSWVNHRWQLTRRRQRRWRREMATALDTVGASETWDVGSHGLSAAVAGARAQRGASDRRVSRESRFPILCPVLCRVIARSQAPLIHSYPCTHHPTHLPRLLRPPGAPLPHPEAQPHTHGLPLRPPPAHGLQALRVMPLNDEMQVSGGRGVRAGECFGALPPPVMTVGTSSL